MHPEAPSLVRKGIDLFNRGEFYECHEVLEEAWTPTIQPERWFLQALIHFAVGFYHHQQGNQTGAERQLGKGLKKIQRYLPEYGGIRTARLEAAVRECFRTVKVGGRVEAYPKVERFAEYVSP